jgi:hypothetical protein
MLSGNSTGAVTPTLLFYGGSHVKSHLTAKTAEAAVMKYNQGHPVPDVPCCINRSSENNGIDL